MEFTQYLNKISNYEGVTIARNGTTTTIQVSDDYDIYDVVEEIESIYKLKPTTQVGNTITYVERSTTMIDTAYNLCKLTQYLSEQSSAIRSFNISRTSISIEFEIKLEHISQRQKIDERIKRHIQFLQLTIASNCISHDVLTYEFEIK